MNFKEFYMVEEDNQNLINVFANRAAKELNIVYRGIQTDYGFDPFDKKYDNNKTAILYRNNYIVMFNDDYGSTTSVTVIVPKTISNYNDFLNILKDKIAYQRKIFSKNLEEGSYFDVLPDNSLTIKNIDSWPDDKLFIINNIMRKNGYDVRGAEDTKDFIKRLSYHGNKIKSNFKDWIEVIKRVFAYKD